MDSDRPCTEHTGVVTAVANALMMDRKAGSPTSKQRSMMPMTLSMSLRFSGSSSSWCEPRIQPWASILCSASSAVTTMSGTLVSAAMPNVPTSWLDIHTKLANFSGSWPLCVRGGERGWAVVGKKSSNSLLLDVLRDLLLPVS